MLTALAWFSGSFAAVTAALLTRLFPRYRPIAIALVVVLSADVVRELLAMSDSVGALLADRVLVLAHPAGTAWLALRLLAGVRRPALVALGSPLAASILVTAEGFPPLLAFGLFHAVCVLIQLWSVGLLWVTGRPLWRPERAALLLCAGEAAARLGPWLGEPERFWDIGLAQGVLVALVLCYHQVRWIASLTSSAGSSASARPWHSWPVQ